MKGSSRRSLYAPGLCKVIVIRPCSNRQIEKQDLRSSEELREPNILLDRPQSTRKPLELCAEKTRNGIAILGSLGDIFNITHDQEEPGMNPPPPTPRLLYLPYEIRMQIWYYAIPTNTDLRYCPCLDQPPRTSETAICCCHQDSAPATHPSTNDPPPIDNGPPKQKPNFLLGPEELLSLLPLVCKQIFEDTKSITQPPKKLTVCSPQCMTSLLFPLTPNQLSTITKITIAIDLRIFRPPPASGRLASFHDIWKCIYNTRIAADRAIRKSHPSPTVERMNADMIEPALDFYPLEVGVGMPFDRQEIAFRRYWSDPGKGGERVAELRRIVGNRSREGLPVPGRWRGDQVGGMIGGMGRGSA